MSSIRPKKSSMPNAVKPASSLALEAAFSVACSQPLMPELKGWTSPFPQERSQWTLSDKLNF
ncbi:hypothetical protein BT93_K0704 [Corymbia citriodora subsp. variegata]|nr:hypothetical protein BT93_K0704 [Corymbia citriodora subsp. variegata]